MKFVIYNPITGEITGRVRCSTKQAENYPYRREVSDEEFDERPELFQKVSLANPAAALVALPEEEARKKGATQDQIEAFKSSKVQKFKAGSDG